MHSKRIVHLDIKPDNTLTAKKDGKVRLIDFGLSKALQETDTCIGNIGTPSYKAPELRFDFWNGFKADVWALGITIWEIISGKKLKHELPHEEGEQFDEQEFLCQEKTVSFELANFLRRCFEFDPEKRASMEELVQHKWLDDSQSLTFPSKE